MSAANKSIFTYLYRDAGNYKAWGELLLDGTFSDEEIEQIEMKLDSKAYFIAEQIGVPALCQTLWDDCESSFNEDDHVWHEFSEIREAKDDDLERLKPWGTASELLDAINRVVKWDEALSPNWNR